MPPLTRKHSSRQRIDRWWVQDSVEERFKERKAAAEEQVEPEVDEQGKALNKKQRLQAKRAAEKERARQRQAAQGLMPSAVCLCKTNCNSGPKACLTRDQAVA